MVCLHFPDDQLLSDAVYKVIGNIAQSEIGIVARPDDNGAVYKCTATNAATSTPLVDTVTLTVLCESCLKLLWLVCRTV